MTQQPYKMDEKTAEALEQSIAKWQEHAKCRTMPTKLGPENCALCLLHHPSFVEDNDCSGCPVYAETGEEYCMGTPFTEADRAHRMWKYNDDPRDAVEFRAAAQKEVEFLESLRKYK